jgi:hypothetical protein
MHAEPGFSIMSALSRILQHPGALLVNAYSQVYNYALFARFRAPVPEFAVTSRFSTCTGIPLPMQNGTLSEKSDDFILGFQATPPFVQHIAAPKAVRG